MEMKLNAGETKILKAIKELSKEKEGYGFTKKRILEKAGFDINYVRNHSAFRTLKEKNFINETNKNSIDYYFLNKNLNNIKIFNNDIVTTDMSDEQFLEEMRKLVSKNGIIDMPAIKLANIMNYGSCSSQFYKHINSLINKHKIDKIKNGKNINYKILNVINDNKEKVNDNEPLSLKIINLGEFNNIDIKIIDSEIGKVIPIKYIYKALNVNRQTIYNRIYSNKELLENQIIKIRLGIQNTYNNCITKDGIMAILMKLNYNLFPEDKKNLILDFQKWIVEKMGKLVSTGNVSIDEEEQKEIQQNIGKTLNLSEKDIDILFDDVEKLITNKLHGLHNRINDYREECKLQDNEINNYKNREKQWANRVVDLREKIYSIR